MTFGRESTQCALRHGNRLRKSVRVRSSGSRHYSWELLKVPDDVFLPTSDNPFCTFRVRWDGNVDHGMGVGVSGTHIVMPITPTWLLHTCVGYEAPKCILEETPAFWDITRAVIIKTAHRYVYATCKDPEIEKMRPSLVAPEYLAAYDKAMENWMRS